jgi:hypothetical protein
MTTSVQSSKGVKRPKKSFSFSAEDDYLQVSFHLLEANFDGADDDVGKEG